MAKNQVVVDCPAGEWTNVTDANTTTMTYMVMQGPVYLRFADTAAEPAAGAQGYIYLGGEGENLISVADLAAGVVSAALWARPIGGTKSGQVLINFT